jgi:hypothetical protein
MHDIALLCGLMAALLIFTTFVTAGVPKVVYAWTIPIYYLTNTPVETGGNTTISWYASSAQYCTLTGPTIPCVTSKFGPYTKTYCPGVTAYGTNPGSINQGNVNTGPINGPTSYTLSCYSPAGCSWGCNDGFGNSAITVYPSTPLPTTLTSFTATPTILKGNKATIAWTGNKGTRFSACDLTGGQYGGGTWFTALPGSITTGSLSTTTSYNMNCVDTNGGQTGWRSATVTVTAPVVCANGLNGASYPTCSCPSGQSQQPSGATTCTLTPVDICTDINGTQVSLPNGCTGPKPSPTGLCIPTGGSFNGAACTCPLGTSLVSGACTPPADRCNNFTGVQSSIPANCHVNADGVSCSANSGYEVVGSSCVAAGVIQSFTANPLRVRKGGTANVSWSTTNMSVCTVSAFTTAATATLSSAFIAELTPVVNSKTIYTLSCNDAAGLSYSASITVNLVPETIEH